MADFVTTESTLENQCMICLCDMSRVKGVVDCMHKFCFECIRRWRGDRETQLCPVCKTPFSEILRIDEYKNAKIDPPVIRDQYEEIVLQQLLLQRRREARREVNEVRMINIIMMLGRCCVMSLVILLKAFFRR